MAIQAIYTKDFAVTGRSVAGLRTIHANVCRGMVGQFAMLVMFVSMGLIVVPRAYGDEPQSKYYMSDLASVEFYGDNIPDGLVGEKFDNNLWSIEQSRVTIDVPGEAYLLRQQSTVFARPDQGSRYDRPHLAVRVSEGADVTGVVYLVPFAERKVIPVKFRITRQIGSSELRVPFNVSKATYYQDLLLRDLPGAAWFRHQLSVAAREGGIELRNDVRTMRQGNSRDSDLEGTFALVSGGRAISENLQLDRVLPEAAADHGALCPLEIIPGIQIREFDWSSRVKDAKPAEDPLARFIPADQHALFLPSFAAMIDVLDHADELGPLVSQVAESRPEDDRIRERYQRQLCLPLGTVERLVGKSLIREVAVTGGDPYFRTGTDVAVLFGSNSPEELRSLLSARMATMKATTSDAIEESLTLRGVIVQSLRTADRSICAYLAKYGDTVVVTNSHAQLDRLISTWQGERASLATLDEYRFFRHRYPRGDGGDKSFLVISDPTIRRWCGPKWRIAASRRTRAAAVMASLQAEHMAMLVRGPKESKTVVSPWYVPGVQQLVINANGVSSDVYGNLEFQTPIMELNITHVTEQEKGGYEAWRNGYQRNWSTRFDPIAVSFRVQADGIDVDLTVMPLIDSSTYQTVANISRGVQVDSRAVDLHLGTLVHASMSLNNESTTLRSYAMFIDGAIQSSLPKPFDAGIMSWLGKGMSLYIDDDPLWNELQSADDPQKFIEQNANRMPIAIHVDIRDGLKLAMFLTAARAFSGQSVPGITSWEEHSYRDRGYVKVMETPQARSNNTDRPPFSLCYYASGSALIFSPNEATLKRAIDRQIDGSNQKNVTVDAATTPAPHENVTTAKMFGDNVNIVIDRRAIDVLAGVFGRNYQSVMQQRAWSNLPILNEWRRVYPDHDPVQLHEKYWQTRLVCPGGGNYRWNEQWQTMESTVYGHPGEPRLGPVIPASLRTFVYGGFGLTFEPDGMRGRFELRRASP